MDRPAQRCVRKPHNLERAVCLTAAPPFRPGLQVPEEVFEGGVGGMRRRVVLAPGDANANCMPFPNVTAANLNQMAGISYRNSTVLFLTLKARPSCWFMDSLTHTPSNAGVAGVLSMFSDKSDSDGRHPLVGWNLKVLTEQGKPIKHPIASITRDRPGTHGGMGMATEIMHGHAVTMFWPGTGAIDPAERAALKEFYSTGISAWTFDFANIGSSGSTMTREEFISDVDNLKDPCGGAGNVTERLDGVHCIGGHVVFITLRGYGGAHVRFLPPSMGALTYLKVFERSNYGGTVGNWPTLTFPPEIGNWSQLKSFVYCGDTTLDTKLSLPASMGTWRNMTFLDIADMGLQGDFPTGVFASPSIVAVRIEAVPLFSIPPVGGMSNLAVFSLKNNGLKGPMPSFEGLTKLSTISFEGNKVTGGMVGSFDGCSSLKELDLKGNALDCELFNFIGCTELTKIDISRNKLRGAIPVSWGLLKKVKIIRASSNEIGGPNRSYLKPLSSMTAVLELDLSRNIIGWERYPGCSTEFGDACNHGPDWMTDWMNAKMRVVDLSRNRLRPPSCLHESSCALSNQMQGIGLIANIYPNLVSVDLSHNELKEVFSLAGVTANWVSLAIRYHNTQ